MGNSGLSQTNGSPSFGDKTQQGHSDHYPGSIWNSGSTNDGSSSTVRNPSTTNRGSGSGGGVGIGPGGFGNLFGGALSGAFSSAQASSHANSGSGVGMSICFQ